MKNREDEIIKEVFNSICMRAIVSYVYNSIPSDCHGSPEKVRAWLAKFRGGCEHNRIIKHSGSSCNDCGAVL